MEFDPARDYPLGSRRADLVATPGGTPLTELTLEHARQGGLAAGDLRATPGTLCRQAAVARAAQRTALADSLERAAELAAVPDGELLAVYTALRPGRATRGELEEWALRLEGWGAHRTAAFVREAASAYAVRGLLRV